MNYGLPYRGSKSKIANKLLDIMPPAEYFCDLFFGGGAMTHAAMLCGKYNKFIANDIIPDVIRLFNDAICGKYANESRWISRDDFFALKDSDSYVRLCWSFGNNQRDYIYSKKIEPLKYAFHCAIYFNDVCSFRELGIDIGGLEKLPISRDKYLKIKRCLKNTIGRIQLQSLEATNRLQSLEAICCGGSLDAMYGDYKNVIVPNDSVIYCDPPYKGVGGYLNDFDHDEFYEWVRNHDKLIFISEYSMPDDFVSIKQVKHISTLGHSGKDVTESLYVHESKINLLSGCI